MKRIIFYLLGNILISLGVALLIKAELGTGSWDAMYVGLAKTFGLTVGSWVFIGGAAVMFINKFISKDKLDISAFLTLFIGGLFIDLFLGYILTSLYLINIYIKIIVFVVAIFIFALGIAVYIQANFATNPIDNLMISLNKRFGFSYRLGRTIGELSALTIALIFGGPIFLGTVIVVFSVGPLIQLFNTPLKKWYENI